MSARNLGTRITTGLLARITLMYELKPHVSVDRATVFRTAYPSQGFSRKRTPYSRCEFCWS